MPKLPIYDQREYPRSTDYLTAYDENGKVIGIRGLFFLKGLVNESQYLALWEDEKALREDADSLLGARVDTIEGDYGPRITTLENDLAAYKIEVNDELYGVGGIEESYNAAIDTKANEIYSFIDTELYGANGVESDYTAAIDQKADEINTSINNKLYGVGGIEEGYKSEVDALENQIDLTIFTNGELDAEVVLNKISALNGQVVIDADFLNINSTTSFATGYDPSEKKRVFRGTSPTPPYDVNDLWFDDYDDQWIAVNAQPSVESGGVFSMTDWEKATVGQTDIDNLQSQIDNIEVSNSLFEVVNEGQSDEYIKANVPFVSVGEIQAWTDDGSFPPTIFESLPYATATSRGGVQVIQSDTTYESGIRLNATSKKLEIDPSYSSSASWGSITGTLSNQTDLQSALNSKLDATATAVNASELGGQLPSYYTDITARLGYTPLNKVTFDDLFEKVDDGSGNFYIKAKYTLTSVADIIAYASSPADIGIVWDNMPYANETSIGGVQVIQSDSIYENGIRLNATSKKLEIDPTYSDSFDETANYSPSGIWDFIGTLEYGGVNVATETWVDNNYHPLGGSDTLDFTVNNLTLYGQVNHWLEDVITIEDASLQLNAIQDDVRVKSGLIIYDNDTSTELSKLYYGTDDKWKIDGNNIWHSGNDGSGSGLDADKLDGIDSSQFVRSDVSDYMNKSLTFNSDNWDNHIRIQRYSDGDRGIMSMYRDNTIDAINIRVGTTAYAGLNVMGNNRVGIGKIPNYTLEVNGNMGLNDKITFTEPTDNIIKGTDYRWAHLTLQSGADSDFGADVIINTGEGDYYKGEFKVNAHTIIDDDLDVSGNAAIDGDIIQSAGGKFVSYGDSGGDIFNLYGFSDTHYLNLEYGGGTYTYQVKGSGNNYRRIRWNNYDGSPFIYMHYNGNVHIGSTSTPSEKLEVNGNILASDEVTAFSDSRLKSIIGTTPSVLDRIKNLSVYDYTRTDQENGKLRTGLIAQELKSYFPQFVLGEETENSYLSINYAEFGAAMAVKGLQEIDEKYEDKVRRLERRVEELEQQLKN